MATQIDAARLLMYRAAWMKDQGKKTTKESSMAKLFASEISVEVCEEAIQIHGGYGYTKDYPARNTGVIRNFAPSAKGLRRSKGS
jgi:alkylation response protein AidB-like acyl-CoA dehydrogenase